MSHDQIGTNFPTGEVRVEYFSQGALNSSSEIITYNTYALTNDTAIVDRLIESFLSSKLHRYLLLRFTSRSCVMAIHHSFNKNLCVVNFTCGEYGTPYAQYNWSYFDESEEDREKSRTEMDRFAAYYEQLSLNAEQ